MCFIKVPMQVQQQCLSRALMMQWMREFAAAGFSVYEVGISVWNNKKRVVAKKIDSEELQVVFTNNSTIASRELAVQFNVDHTTMLRQLKRIGKVLAVGKWVPYELSPESLQQRVTCWEKLLSRLLQTPFLGRLLTGDEK